MRPFSQVFTESGVPSRTLCVCEQMQSPPNAAPLQARAVHRTGEKECTAIIWSMPLLISREVLNRASIGGVSGRRLRNRTSMVNSIIYPPRRVIVEKPSIMQASSIGKSSRCTDTCFFETADSLK